MVKSRTALVAVMLTTCLERDGLLGGAWPLCPLILGTGVEEGDKLCNSIFRMINLC